MDRGAQQATVRRVAESDMTEELGTHNAQDLGNSLGSAGWFLCSVWW